MPLRDALVFAHNALIGSDLRAQIKIGASGKIISGFDMAVTLALGADWCNAARGFMLALGCLQSQKCHTNRCPVGIATQDPLRIHALDVNDKAERVFRFHQATTTALEHLAAAVGVSSPNQLDASHFFRRTSTGQAESLSKTYPLVRRGSFLESDFANTTWQAQWERACPHAFDAARGG